MFVPSPILLKRTPVRLKGFRRPAIRTLRRATAKLHPSATVDLYEAPHCESTAGLTVHEAWERYSMPLLSLLKSRGIDIPFQGEGSGDQSKSNPVIRKIWSHEPKYGTRKKQILQDAKQDLPQDTPSILKLLQKRQTGPMAVPFEDSELRPGYTYNPPRYKLPSTLYWQHSICMWRPSNLAPLPVTSQNVGRLLRSFFNRTPKNEPPALPQLSTTDSRFRTPIRVYLSDRSSLLTDMPASLTGKISRQGNHEFLLPWRKLRRSAPEITYKHYANGTVGIQVFLYDRKLESMKQKRARLWRQLSKMISHAGLIKSSSSNIDGRSNENDESLDEKFKVLGVI